jgi:hypothetical protein
MRKARDRTAVAVRLSSIPIVLASIPFNDNSRKRSSSAAVQSFMDDLLSPLDRVIGLAPQSEPSMRRGSAPVFYFADVTYFFPGRPRRPKMELPKRNQSFDLLMKGFAADYKVRLEAREGGAMKRRRRSVRKRNRQRIAAHARRLRRERVY